jgi:hypothetical protein
MISVNLGRRDVAVDGVVSMSSYVSMSRKAVERFQLSDTTNASFRSRGINSRSFNDHLSQPITRVRLLQYYSIHLLTPRKIRLFILTLLLVPIMAQPARPPTLLPSHLYVHVTSPSPTPPTISSLPFYPDLAVQYVGPVGELKGEYIYEVTAAGEAVKRDGELWRKDGVEVIRALKGVDGVKRVEVMEVRQRAKRDEF